MTGNVDAGLPNTIVRAAIFTVDVLIDRTVARHCLQAHKAAGDEEPTQKKIFEKQDKRGTTEQPQRPDASTVAAFHAHHRRCRCAH